MVLVEQIDFITIYHLMKITDGTKNICCIYSCSVISILNIKDCEPYFLPLIGTMFVRHKLVTTTPFFFKEIIVWHILSKYFYTLCIEVLILTKFVSSSNYDSKIKYF